MTSRRATPPTPVTSSWVDLRIEGGSSGPSADAQAGALFLGISQPESATATKQTPVVDAARSALRDVIAGLRAPLPDLSLPSLAVPIAMYAAFALVVGFAGGLLRPEAPTWFELTVLPPLLVVYPSLIEEVVFRGLLLPRRLMSAPPAKRLVAISISTALFVLMHPLNAWFVGLSDTSQFVTPTFLIIVTALGFTCGHLYLQTGSLRAPILLHWVTVVAWNLFLGRDFSVG